MSIAVLLVTVFSVQSYPTHIRKTQDAVCQNGGNAACWSYCEVSGHGGGHCEGVNPNVNCVCDNLLNKTQDDTCEDGGNVACLAYCATQGFNCGFCDGVHPNTHCVCEHCLMTNKSEDMCQNSDCNMQCLREGHTGGGFCIPPFWPGDCKCVGIEEAPVVNCPSKACTSSVCTDGYCYGVSPSVACVCDHSQDEGNVNCTDINCVLQCVQEGCKTGKCSGNPTEPCECLDCSTDLPPPVCNDGACSVKCSAKGCSSSTCKDGHCECNGCLADPCPSSQCVSACHSNGCKGAKCVPGGPDQCLCYGCKDELNNCDPLGCMSKCQAEGYKQGMCGPTGDCQCAFPNTTVLSIDAGVPCMLGGDTFCQNVCSKANCSKGHCGLSGHKEYCVCEDCHEDIDRTPSTDVDFPHSGCDWGQCKSYCEARGMNGCCSAGSPSGCVCCSSPVACQQQCNVDTSVVSDSTTLVIVGKTQMSCEVGGRAACIASCKVQGCETGYCVGPAGSATCQCSRCSTNSTTATLAIVDRSKASCQVGGDGACELSCQLHNCDDGHCSPDNTCICTGCVAKPTQVTGLVLIGCPHMSCEVGGRAACIASCKVQGCETGYCEGPAGSATCVCSRCSNVTPTLALHVVNTPTASCSVGGQQLCTAVCKMVGCTYGNCTLNGNDGECVCGGCHRDNTRMVEHVKQE
jgi:hypothetical protein